MGGEVPAADQRCEAKPQFDRGAAIVNMGAMNAWEPIDGGAEADALEAFHVIDAAAGTRRPPPLVFASPHSGRVYPRRR